MIDNRLVSIEWHCPINSLISEFQRFSCKKNLIVKWCKCTHSTKLRSICLLTGDFGVFHIAFCDGNGSSDADENVAGRFDVFK